MNRKAYILLPIVLAGAMILGACAGGGETNTGTEPARSEAWLMWQEAVAEGYTGDYLDFLSEYGEAIGAEQNGIGVQKGLASAVKIEVLIHNQYGVAGAAYGSGVVYSVDYETGDAIIITNYHVVYDSYGASNEPVPYIASSISCWLYGGERDEGTLTATYVGGAMGSDIAVLKVDGSAQAGDSSVHTNADVILSSAVRPATVGDSDKLYAGQDVYALGNANGSGLAVTSGTVSMEIEYITVSSADGRQALRPFVIRTDAAINHGNSGGGLFSAAGELVGIVNARNEYSDVREIGYAIPSNYAIAVAENILAASEGGRMSALRANFGAAVSAVASRAVRDDDGILRITETLQVLSVNYGSAAEGFILPEDILLSYTLNGKKYPLTRAYMLEVAMFRIRLGDTVTFHVLRGGEETSVEVTFGSVNDFRTFA